MVLPISLSSFRWSNLLPTIDNWKHNGSNIQFNYAQLHGNTGIFLLPFVRKSAYSMFSECPLEGNRKPPILKWWMSSGGLIFVHSFSTRKFITLIYVLEMYYYAAYYSWKLNLTFWIIWFNHFQVFFHPSSLIYWPKWKRKLITFLPASFF